MEEYFTEEKVKDLTSNHNWILVAAEDGLYVLKQKDKRYMKTIPFSLPDNVAEKYL
ncbi:MAG: hypothetical protein OES84_00230 [Kiritimatiellaceae bacterium]|nr:hypothetical protein [Kiritimatiellaceae bacterium]